MHPGRSFGHVSTSARVETVYEGTRSRPRAYMLERAPLNLAKLRERHFKYIAFRTDFMTKRLHQMHYTTSSTIRVKVKRP
jgi:hypothetical protein